MKQISDTALFVDVQGKIFRVKTPFLAKLRDSQGIERKVLVKKIIFEDETIVLYEVDDVLVTYSTYEIIKEGFVRYEISHYIW